MDKGFPRLIKDDFPGIEPQIDAVLQAFGRKNFMSLTMGAFGYFMVLQLSVCGAV